MNYQIVSEVDVFPQLDYFLLSLFLLCFSVLSLYLYAAFVLWLILNRALFYCHGRSLHLNPLLHPVIRV